MDEEKNENNTMKQTITATIPTNEFLMLIEYPIDEINYKTTVKHAHKYLQIK